ncbi:hypothetical protein [Cryocola sp. 340MFSha3.1]|uniref:hypothetical protein n=1 Tax=Cryocola sp. 340MFSha3.1 TaxID=1169145 RepID=UPI00036E7309|nr:hypothetical protein [Cryocola sp. 340MFSha3.1]
MNATPDAPDEHQSDADQTAKDRLYSPASERETEVKQEESDGAAVRPGTGGPDDVGDIPVPPEDDLDPAAIVERGDPGRRAGDA